MLPLTQVRHLDVQGGGYGVPNDEGGVDLVVVRHGYTQHVSVSYFHGERWVPSEGKTEQRRNIMPSEEQRLLEGIHKYGEDACRTTFQNWPKCGGCKRGLWTDEDKARGFSGRCWSKRQRQLAVFQADVTAQLDAFTEEIRQAQGKYGEQAARLSYVLRTLDADDLMTLVSILNSGRRS